MHTTFNLCARRAQLEARLALPNGLLELPHVADANVLERVLEANIQVGDEGMHRTLVLHIARHTLSDLDGRRLGEIS